MRKPTNIIALKAPYKVYKYWIILLCIATSNLAISQKDSTSRKVDSIISSVETANTSTIKKIEQLVQFAGRARYTPETKRLIEKAILISTLENNKLSLAHSYYSLGNFHYYNSKIDSCLVYLDLAQASLEKIENPLLLASILTTKGGAYNKLGAVILAISTQIEAKNKLDSIDTLQLNTEEKTKQKGKMLVINNSLANLYIKTEDYDAALIHYNKAYDAAIKLKSNSNASLILGNKGELLIRTNKLEEALNTLQKSKEMKVKYNLPGRIIANTDLLIGKAYYKMEDYPKAEVKYNNALEVHKKNNYMPGVMQALIQRGHLYYDQGRVIEAKEDCITGKEIAIATNDSEYLIQACECLYKSNKVIGNTKEALNNHELYTKAKDSLFNEKNIRKITQIGMQYEFDKKEEQQNLITEKKHRQKNWILLGLASILLFMSIVFAFYRKKLKYQKTITLQKQKLQQQKITELTQKSKLIAMNSMIEGQEAERLRIAKDLHDSLGGLLSSVKLYFNTFLKEPQKNKSDTLSNKTNNLIDEACIEVRRISHNMMPHALSISGLEGTIQDITDRLKEQGYNATFEANDIPKLESTKEVMIYRLAQELISNIRKHAAANSIFIQLFRHNNEIKLQIEDDGTGFDYKKAMHKNGLGLKSINSRVAFLDGSINWDTQPGRGTNINVNIPIL